MKDAADVPRREVLGTGDELLARFLSTSRCIGYLEIGSDLTIQEANWAIARQLGTSSPALKGRPLASIVTDSDARLVESWIAGASLPAARGVLLNFVTVDDEPFTLRCLAAPRGDRWTILGEPEHQSDAVLTTEIVQVNNRLAVLSREHARKSRELEQARAELQRALEELRTSHWHIQKIREVLPICMGCRQVRPGGTEWEPLIAFLEASDIPLSHGYCPSCLKEAMAAHGMSEIE